MRAVIPPAMSILAGALIVARFDLWLRRSLRGHGILKHTLTILSNFQLFDPKNIGQGTIILILTVSSDSRHSTLEVRTHGSLRIDGYAFLIYKKISSFSTQTSDFSTLRAHFWENPSISSALVDCYWARHPSESLPLSPISKVRRSQLCAVP